jgi:hypothetical protein
MMALLRKIKAIDKAYLIFFLVAILVAWQMLLPGYVLTLDMIFGPLMPASYLMGDFRNAWPVWKLIELASALMPAWVVQKFIILTLFWSIPASAYYAFRRSFAGQPAVAAYWCGLFFLFNPFVYTRFLAGHWLHLFAYALLPLLLAASLALADKSNWRQIWPVSALLALIGVLSLHFLLLGACLSVLVLAVAILRRLWLGLPAARLLVQSAGAAMLAVVLSSYWLYPFVFGQSSLGFGSVDWWAFKTATSPHWGLLPHILVLGGFWGEAQPWAGYFIWPWQSWWWLSGVVACAALVVLGAWRLWKTQRWLATALMLVAVTALVLASGVADGPFKGVNLWLFENVSWWGGFRDSQKWSALLALVYAFSGAFGVAWAWRKLVAWQEKLASEFAICLLIWPVLLGLTMVGGFARQLTSVQYPAEWQAAKEILLARPTTEQGKVLFLPWHQYLSLDFNRQLITANPAKLFFGPDTVISLSPEIGALPARTGDEAYYSLEQAIWSGESSVIHNALRQAGISQVISYLPEGWPETDQSDFLHLGGFEAIYSQKSLTLFNFVLR